MLCRHGNCREIPRAIPLTPQPTENDLLTGGLSLKEAGGYFFQKGIIPIHHQSQEGTLQDQEADPLVILEVR